MIDNEGFLKPLLGAALPWFYRDSLLWTAVGLFGNLLFSSRFLVQWLLSERQRRVVVPAAFWHLSLWGSAVALVYALHVDKLPVILGYLFLPVVYARNLILLRRERQAGSLVAEPVAGHAPTPPVVRDVRSARRRPADAVAASRSGPRAPKALPRELPASEPRPLS